MHATRRMRRGFTLPELLVAFSLLTVVTGAAVGLLLSTVRGMRAQREITNTEDALRTFESLITISFRSAGANPYDLTGTSKPTINPNPLNRATWDNVRLTADMNPANRVTTDNLEDIQFDLTTDTVYARWSTSGTRAALVAPVSRLLFEYYQANGTQITSAANIALAKQVRVTIEAPRRAGSTDLIRRQWWIQLRNAL